MTIIELVKEPNGFQSISIFDHSFFFEELKEALSKLRHEDGQLMLPVSFSPFDGEPDAWAYITSSEQKEIADFIKAFENYDESKLKVASTAVDDRWIPMWFDMGNPDSKLLIKKRYYK